MRSSSPHMLVLTALAGAASLATPAGAVAQAHTCEGASLTYLANEAVLVEAAGGSLLIDGPFTAGVEPYPRIEAGTLRRIRTAEPPFDAVDWILITHEHADHGDPDAIADHLLANPKARLASTLAVIEAVRAALARRQGLPELPDELARRLVAAEPAQGRTLVIHAGVPHIEALALHHGPDPGVAVNVAWLVEIDGVRLLHAGDAQVGDADLASLPPLAELGIDVALMPTWYVASEAFRPVLPKLEARRIFLMHFAGREAGDRFYRRQGGWGGMMRRVTESGLPIEPLVRRGAVVCLD